MQRTRILAQQVLAAVPTAGDVAKQMAPTGKLRVALNMRNELLVSGKSAAGEPEGLAPSMGRAFAEKLGVPVEYVPYESADKLADDAKEDKWDVAMIGADPARAEFIDFTPPYCQIEATYAVPTTSGLRTCAEVDKEGVKIAGCDGAAYVLWLERNLKKATLEKIKGHDATYAHFTENALEAVAGLRPKLKKDGAKRPGTRRVGVFFFLGWCAPKEPVWSVWFERDLAEKHHKSRLKSLRESECSKLLCRIHQLCPKTVVLTHIDWHSGRDFWSEIQRCHLKVLK